MNWSKQAFNAFRKAAFQQKNLYYAGAASAAVLTLPLHDAAPHIRAQSTAEKKKPVYIWGNNLYGIADPSTYGKEDAVKYPRQVDCWGSIQLASVALGEKHAAAIDTEGNVYQWGESFWKRSGIFGCFNPVCTLKGQGCKTVKVNEGGVYAVDGKGQIVVLSLDCRQPKQIVKLEEAVEDIQAGQNHLVALGANGSVFTGSTSRYGNIFGQLGRGSTDSTRRALDQLQHPPLLPESIMGVIQGWPRSERVIEKDAVTHGPDHNGPETLFPDISLEPIDDQWWMGNRVTQIACGDHHTLVRTDNGNVYGFGSNEMLQLGLGPYDPKKAINPCPVSVLKADPESGSKCTFIACGAETSYFVMDSAKQTQILAAGFGQHGQLGNKTWTHAEGIPTPVHSISHLSYYDESTNSVSPIRCRYISAGRDHSVAVMNTYAQDSMLARYGYDVYVWGGNKKWQLGIANKRHNVSEPATIEPPDPTSKDVDYTDLSLSRAGPTAKNPEGTLTYIGGQLQILPEGNKPMQKIQCGRDVTIIY